MGTGRSPHRSPRGTLPAVRRQGPWVAWGLALQVIGVAIPVITAIRRAHREGLGGSLTHYTVTLIGRQMLHSNADLALVVLGVLLFTAGAVALARPFVRRRSTLVVAVPLAAVIGLTVLGVLALVVGALVAFADGGDTGVGETIGNLLGSAPPRRRGDDDDHKHRRR